ncbi:MAG: ACT domain-containing protein [Desulfuromusa sp.]|jgi:glycine cleavage system transcriptional repressor|nr:ACT domain-containing protein [Desulfuromusa sp.]
MQHFALTIIGRDRPGIVSQVTEILFKGGFNIADSSCSILGGQFSMILIISNPDISTKEEFSDTFSPLEENNLSVFIRTLKPGGEIRTELEGELCMISVYGADKPGIVYQVARELGERSINITDLNTKLIGDKAKPVYVMMLEAMLPENTEVEEVETWMRELKEKLQVDISVRSLAAMEL